MEAIQKQAFISNLYNRTELLLDAAVKNYQNLDESVLNFRTGEKSWSIVECFAHLNSYGNYYLPKLEALTKNPTSFSASAFRSGWLGAYFVRLMENESKRYKAAKQHLPEVENAYNEVATFINQQERLLICLKSFESLDLNKWRIPISINRLIRLKVGDILAFLVTHAERHHEQIKKIRRNQNATLS